MRLKGDIDVEESADEAVEEDAENTLEGGLEIGVSRSEENSNPAKFPR
jgi:hypothetical protein